MAQQTLRKLSGEFGHAIDNSRPCYQFRVVQLISEFAHAINNRCVCSQSWSTLIKSEVGHASDNRHPCSQSRSTLIASNSGTRPTTVVRVLIIWDNTATFDQGIERKASDGNQGATLRSGYQRTSVQHGRIRGFSQEERKAYGHTTRTCVSVTGHRHHDKGATSRHHLTTLLSSKSITFQSICVNLLKTMDPQLENWTAERDLVMSMLVEFRGFVDESMGSTPIRDVQNRYEFLKSLYERFNRLQDQIDTAVAVYTNTDIEMLPSHERDRFEDLYFDLMAEVDTYITNVYSERQKRIVANRLGRSAAIPSNSSQQQQIVKLPPSEADAREVTFKDIRVTDVTKDDCVSHRDTDEPRTVSTSYRESINLAHSNSFRLEQGPVKTNKFFSRPRRSSPGGMVLHINGKRIKAGGTMITVPLGCSKFSILQARHLQTNPQARPECLRSVYVEYRQRIAPIRKQYRLLFPRDTSKDLEGDLEIHFIQEDRESSLGPNQSSQFSTVYDTSVTFTGHVNDVSGNQRFIHRELDTALTQVESYPDSRSLFPASSDATYSSPLSFGQSSQWDPGGIAQPQPESRCGHAAIIRIVIWDNQGSAWTRGPTRARACKEADPHIRRPTRTQAYRDAGLCGRKSTRIQVHTDTGPHGYRSTQIQVHTDTGPRVYRPTRTQACTDTGPRGHTGLHRHGLSRLRAYTGTGLLQHGQRARQEEQPNTENS